METGFEFNYKSIFLLTYQSQKTERLEVRRRFVELSRSFDDTLLERPIEVMEARTMLVTMHGEGGKSYSAVPRIRTQMRRYKPTRLI